jgi:hypothetical protein
MRDIHTDPAYFYCERTRCTMTRESCIKRQSRGAGAWKKKPRECRNCPQGQKIKGEAVTMSGISKDEQEQRRAVGQQIRDMRGSIMTIKTLAEKVGIPKTRLQLIETGQRECPPGLFEKIKTTLQTAESCKKSSVPEPGGQEQTVDAVDSQCGDGLRETAREVLDTRKFEDGFGRHAIITYRNGLYHACTYKVLDELYSIEDWDFLRSVAEKIRELDSENAS